MRSHLPYRDRREAGRDLAAALGAHAHRGGVVVFAIPRGGVPVGYEVAKRLEAPLDVIVVRKLGLPVQPELAMGAIASGGVRVLNSDVIDLGISNRTIDEVTRRERKELERRERLYRGQAPAVDPTGSTAIIVDDGLATGATMRAAIVSLRERGAATIVVAVPVGAVATCNEIAYSADSLVCLNRPADFMAVGEWYVDFGQTSDEEVRDLLERARHADQVATVRRAS